jgi:GH18 family chitinase
MRTRDRRKPSDAKDFVGQFYYNGPETVRRKTAFAAAAGLAGVFVWELGQDDSYGTQQSAPLLPSIATVASFAASAGWAPGVELDAAAAERLLSMAEEQIRRERAVGAKEEL